MSNKVIKSLIAVGILSMFITPIFVCQFEKEDIKETQAVMEFSSVEAEKKEEEEIIHTHIWATKYNNDKHWEYCTVCNKERNEEPHNMIDNWFFGYASCHSSSGDNYSTRICKCGYNYIYRMSHGIIRGWYNTGVRMVHYKHCASCGSWTTSGYCSNRKGRIGCHNPGTCDTCGMTCTKDWHYITRSDDGKGGKCRECNQQFFKLEDYSLTYTEDYSAAIIQFKFVPTAPGVEFTGTMGAYCGNSNYTGCTWTYEKLSDGSCAYKGVYTFDRNKQRKSNLHFLDRTGAIKINGINLYIDSSIINETIWQDHIAPLMTEVGQVDQATSGDWATIKELTIKGEEALANIVTLTIKDKLTKDVIISGAKVNVVDGKFVYKCTPAIEGPAEGRDYILELVDEAGNKREQVFTIYKTDSRAPLLADSRFDVWTQSKKVAIPITDYGAGQVQTSLDNQFSYKDTVYLGGVYYAYYNYDEENYGVDEHTLYLKDGLGNARREQVTIGKIDNTKPTITVMDWQNKSDNLILKLGTDDYSRNMSRQGSGVESYAVTTTPYQPTSWQNKNEFKITEPGMYYVWAKDRAGNIADFRILKVGSDMKATIDAKPPVVDNSPIKARNVVRLRDDDHMYGYYSFDIETKSNSYIKADDMYIHMFGKNNNDERMYMYLSSSENTVLTKEQLKSYGSLNSALASKLNSDPNIIKWKYSNTRNVGSSGDVHSVQGNNVCYLQPNNDIDAYVGVNESKPVYVHIINEDCTEYVQEMMVVKRLIFDMY